MGWSKSFDIRPQRNLINTRGACVKWEQTAPCTCTPPGLAPDPTCQGCHGTGRVDIGSKTIRGLITNATQDRILIQVGWVEDGDLLFSQYPNDCNQLNDYDRIVLLDVTGGEPFFGERLVRSHGITDKASYNIQIVGSVTQTDPGSGVTTTYVKDVDFTVAGRIITWIGSNRPASGSTYAIDYRANFEYTVVNPPFIRYEGQTNLGQRVILKLRNIQGAQQNVSRIQSIEGIGIGGSTDTNPPANGK